MSLLFMYPSNKMEKPTSLCEARCPRAKPLVASAQHFQPPRAQFSTKPLKIENPYEISWAHEVELTVRDYELDQFGVVNNATYAQYCDHVRLRGIKKFGVDHDVLAANGHALAMSEMSLQFISPLRSGDRFVVKVRLSGWSVARMYVDHYIFKLPNQELILKARGTAVWLGKNYRPTRIPKEVITSIVKAQEELECRREHE